MLNLTTGIGGDLVLEPPEVPSPFDAKGTDMAGAAKRLVHGEELLLEICTLDCGTMNFAEADYAMSNTSGMLQAMAKWSVCVRSWKCSILAICGWRSSFTPKN